MNRLFLILGLATFIAGCKKDSADDEAAPSISFTATGNYSITLPVTVTFTAAAANADQVTWDFGDTTTAQGLTVQHTYTAFRNYKVKATAVRGDQSTTITKDIPVTFFRKVDVKGIRVMQIPPFKAGGKEWDAGDDPDLMYSITFPGDTLYESATVLNNTTTGNFTIAPPRSTYNFVDDVKIQLYDKDTGNVPDRENIGYIKFKFCDYLPSTVNYVDSIDLSSNSLRVIVKFDFIY
ncbi:MAG: PKD domain-containing protein [Bacteroidia bacterium]